MIEPPVNEVESVNARPLDEKTNNFLVRELRGSGGIGLQFYRRYLGAMRGIAVASPFLVLLIVSENFFPSGFKWLVAFWVEGCEKGMCDGKTPWEVSLRKLMGGPDAQFSLRVFVVFVAVGLIVRMLSWTLVSGFLANGGRYLHDAMVRSLGGVRVTFFDENPIGRIARRFSGDYAQLTREIPNYISDIISALAELAWIICIVMTQAPLASIACIPCAIMYFRVQNNFRPAAREVQRLSKILETPVWSLFTESMSGFQILRAYGRSDEFIVRLRMLFNRYSLGVLLQSRFTRWLNVRLKFISEVFSLCVTLFVAWSCSYGHMGVGLGGFLMSLTIGLDMSMQWLTRSSSMLETAMVSAERVLEYRQLPDEATGRNETPTPPAISWPAHGDIRFENYSMSYRPDLPVVLNEFNAHLPAGKMIGIIGRTGAGKSSLFQSLFQMVHVRGGRIVIDGVDIGHVPLERARAVFGIIPQEPQLFSGTLRYNLDRTGRFSDARILEALDAVRLGPFVSSLPGGLNYPLYERGANFSVGQRQLMCMARAILCDSKIVLMDEATASVDRETEALIHDALLEGFRGRTILIIAHRLETVRGCHAIAVMSAGRLQEFGSAESILARFSSKTDEVGLEGYLV